MEFLVTLKDKFIQNFIEADRWRYIVDGLGTTLEIALCAVVIGIIIGALVAIVRSTHDKTGRLKWLNAFCTFYTTIVRGTPMVLQLLIMYFVVFSSVNVSKLMVAIVSFSLNSGAYVAEIFRSGIMSIDEGQTEAGRSLGLGYAQTMWYIVIPQAFKNVLPALANEFITLLKETSIAGYIALQDLTKAGDIIRSQTYEAFMPLLGVAVIYLAMVCLLSAGVTRLERRLRASER